MRRIAPGDFYWERLPPRWAFKCNTWPLKLRVLFGEFGAQLKMGVYLDIFPTLKDRRTFPRACSRHVLSFSGRVNTFSGALDTRFLVMLMAKGISERAEIASGRKSADLFRGRN